MKYFCGGCMFNISRVPCLVFYYCNSGCTLEQTVICDQSKKHRVFTIPNDTHVPICFGILVSLWLYRPGPICCGNIFLFTIFKHKCYSPNRSFRTIHEVMKMFAIRNVFMCIIILYCNDQQ